LDADQTEAAIKATIKMLNMIEDEYELGKDLYEDEDNNLKY
jgi:D-citramalate synthase